MLDTERTLDGESGSVDVLTVGLDRRCIVTSLLLGVVRQIVDR